MPQWARIALGLGVLMLGVGTVVIVTANLQPSFSPRELTLIETTLSISLDPSTQLPTVQVSINGAGPYAFIADTGAQATVLSVDLAQELGLLRSRAVDVTRPGGASVSGHLVQLDRVTLGATELRRMDAITVDLGPIWSGPNAPRGILSVATLRGALVTLDFPTASMRIGPGSLRAAADGAIFAWESGRPLPTATLDLAGRSLAANLDTGSSVVLILPSRYATGLPVGPLTSAGADRGLNGQVEMSSAVVDGSLKLGPAFIDRPTIHFAELPMAKVGFPVLRRLTLVIDAEHRLVRIG